MANSNNGNLNLSTTYPHVITQTRPSIMQFPTTHSQDLTTQEAMAAALTTSGLNDPTLTTDDVVKNQINVIENPSNHLSFRLPGSEHIPLHQVHVSTHLQSPRLQQHQLHIPINPHHHVNNQINPNTINSLGYSTIHQNSHPLTHTTPLPLPHPLNHTILPHVVQSNIHHTNHPCIPTSIPTTHQDSLPPVSNIDTNSIRSSIPQIHIPTNLPQHDLKDDKQEKLAGPSGDIQKKTNTRRRRSRTGPATFVCQLVGCGKAFRMQGDLQTHMRKHTGEEPFACSFPDCGMRYKWRSSLSHHEGLHRKSKDFKLKRKPRRPRSTPQTHLQLQQHPAPDNQQDKKSTGGT